MDVQKLVGWNVSRLRIRMHLTQADLAKSSRILDQPYISGLENGKRNPTATILMLLADSLGVQVGELFSIHGAPADLALGNVEIKSRRSRNANHRVPR